MRRPTKEECQLRDYFRKVTIIDVHHDMPLTSYSDMLCACVDALQMSILPRAFLTGDHLFDGKPVPENFPIDAVTADILKRACRRELVLPFGQPESSGEVDVAGEQG